MIHCTWLPSCGQLRVLHASAKMSLWLTESYRHPTQKPSCDIAWFQLGIPPKPKQTNLLPKPIHIMDIEDSMIHELLQGFEICFTVCLSNIMCNVQVVIRSDCICNSWDTQSKHERFESTCCCSSIRRGDKYVHTHTHTHLPTHPPTFVHSPLWVYREPLKFCCSRWLLV